MTSRQLHLNAFLMNTGHHEASWRLPESDPYAHVELDHYVRLARIAARSTRSSWPTGRSCGAAWASARRAPWNHSPCSPPWRRRPGTSA